MTTVILRRPRLGRGGMRGKKGVEGFGRGIIAQMRNPAVDHCYTKRARYNPDDVQLTIRWGCTAEAPSKNVLNTCDAIRQVNDKVESRLLFAANNLAPLSARILDFINQRVDIPYPVIVRPQKHAQGRQLYKCDSMAEVRRAHAKVGDTGYVSAYIPKVEEYRVFVAQGRAVWVAKKTPGNPDAVAWNVAQGGRFDNVRWDDWPLRVVRTAIEAFNLTDLDFGGVDLMVDAGGKAYVLEINSAPSQTSEYRQGCVAKVFDHIIENGKDRIPLIQERGGYRKFIHPAIFEGAQIG